jgi:hypothetical protein
VVIQLLDHGLKDGLFPAQSLQELRTFMTFTFVYNCHADEKLADQLVATSIACNFDQLSIAGQEIAYDNIRDGEELPYPPPPGEAKQERRQSLTFIAITLLRESRMYGPCSRMTIRSNRSVR